MSSSEFDNIFARLKRILSKQAPSFSVTDDTATRYCLEGRPGPAAVRAWGGKLRRPTIPVAWVQLGKAYVSFHLMGLDGNPKAHESMSKELQKRMQGKTCFNFKVADEALFQELERVTEGTCQAFKRAGFIQ